MNFQAQEWLLKRLIHFGADVYAPGVFASLGERLAHVILTNQLTFVRAGSHEGKALTHAEAWERIYDTTFPDQAGRQRHDDT